uniref:Uncharacterized protein n=1 Tax=Rhizophora mucronata TaxID=61149 RepID=A0A2P2NIV9_RHIMU
MSSATSVFRGGSSGCILADSSCYGSSAFVAFAF